MRSKLIDRSGRTIVMTQIGKAQHYIDFTQKLRYTDFQKKYFCCEEVFPVEEYELRLFDNAICRFTMGLEGLRGFQVHILEYYTVNADSWPLGTSPEDTSLKDWLQSRIVPKNRAFVEQILHKFGLSIHDTTGIITACKGLSLNDSFWVVPAGFQGKFADYNLYENDLDDVLALIAYTGVDTGRKVISSSPELTTDGALPKAWRVDAGGNRVLYKGGTSGAANTGREPYSEFLASAVAERMGLYSVHYDLEKWQGQLCSTCKAFTNINTSYASFYSVAKQTEVVDVLRFYFHISDDAFEKIASMFVFDSLIINEDRHVTNFGVLRDNASGQIIGPAPIFDNGYSLFNFVQDADMNDLISYHKDKLTALYVPFDDMAAAVMGPLQKEQLRRMIGFHLPRHPLYNLPEARLGKIEDFLQKRVQQLLLIPNRDRSAIRDEVGLTNQAASLEDLAASAAERAGKHNAQLTPTLKSFEKNKNPR